MVLEQSSVDPQPDPPAAPAGGGSSPRTASDPAGTLAPVSAARAAARFSKALEVAVARVDLSLPQYRLLAFLAGGPERATALAGWLDVSPPSLTALVDGAVARGLVERVAALDDRRCVRHVITEAGEGALERADVAVAEKLGAVMFHLSPSDGRKVVEGLELLGHALDAGREARLAGVRTAHGS